jgi:hypothetical protein
LFTRQYVVFERLMALISDFPERRDVMAVLAAPLGAMGSRTSAAARPTLEAEAAPLATPRIRHLLITDSPEAAIRATGTIVWLGQRDSPPPVGEERCLIAPSSLRAAAIYVAAAPSHFKLALSNPLPFMVLLAEIRAAPALRAA